MLGCADSSDLSLPACKDYIVEKRSVPVEPSYRTEDVPLSYIYTTATKRVRICFVRAGDIVSYQITFTNHAFLPLDIVWICGDMQKGMVPSLICPAPGPGETLQTGIAMEKMAPGQSAVLTYDVIAAFCSNSPMVSWAWAQYRFTDQSGISGCRSCAVFRLPGRRPICRFMRRQFSICDFSRFRYFYIYHRGVKGLKNAYGCALIIKCVIAIDYVDCRKEKRSKIFKDSVRIIGFAENFDRSKSRICLTDLTCDAENRCLITAGFSVSVETD